MCEDEDVLFFVFGLPKKNEGEERRGRREGEARNARTEPLALYCMPACLPACLLSNVFSITSKWHKWTSGAR